jgi:hypothetical protein
VFVEAHALDYHQAKEKPMPRPAIHPGEILADELNELGITPIELSRQISVPPNRISNHPGQAHHDRRHRAPPRPLVSNQRAILAQLAIGVRSTRCDRGGWPRGGGVDERRATRASA